MIKNIDTLADRLKGITFEGKEIEPKKFIELITSDKEVEIAAGTVHFFNDDELSQLKQNEKKTFKFSGLLGGQPKEGAGVVAPGVVRTDGLDGCLAQPQAARHGPA